MAIYVPSIMDAQRRGVEIGRIRMGEKREFTKKNGETGTRPAKLEKFRLTSRSREVIEAAAQILGGHARGWHPTPGVTEWETHTATAVLDVLIPPGLPVQQDMELWGKRGDDGIVCLRRCTGGPDAINQIDNKPCACPADDARRIGLAAEGKACKPTTRLRVVLPDLHIGLWRLDSHGFYAAVELVGRVDLLHQASEEISRARGERVYVPARLRLEQRQRGRNQFGVPVLDIGVSAAQIAAGVGVGALAAVVGSATPSAALPPGGPAAISPAPPTAQPPARQDHKGAQSLADFAQESADRAMRSDTTRENIINFLGHYAASPVLDEFVTVDADAPMVVLRDLLADRLEALTPAGAE